MKGKILTVGLIALTAVGAWLAWAAWNAAHGWVTLDVRDMDVRTVCRKIERQTWKDIHVAPGVTGKVTLKVKRVPLEAVLEIIATQTGSRWTAVYPIYSQKSSLPLLISLIMGQPRDETSWASWRNRPTGFGGGPFAEALRNENQLVTLQIQGRDVEFAALALGRFGRAQIVPENGATNLVWLKLDNATMPEAVEQLAKAAKRKWTVFYVLQPGWFGGRRQWASREGTDTNSVAVATNTNQSTQAGPPMPPFMGGPFGAGREQTPEQKAAQEKQWEAQLATMPPEQRQQAQAMRDQMEQIRSLPPEERRAAFQALAQNPEFQQMMHQRMQGMMSSVIKNSTPEQRVERMRQIIQMRQRFGGPDASGNTPPR